MERAALTVGRVVLVAAAVAGAVALLFDGFGEDFRTWVVVAGLLLVVTGMIVNRAWAAALPLLLAAAFVVLAIVDPGTDGHDGGWEYYGWGFAALAAFIAVVLLVGVGLRRAARAAQRSDFSPQ